jgi:hypothetical protein
MHEIPYARAQQTTPLANNASCEMGENTMTKLLSGLAITCTLAFAAAASAPTANALTLPNAAQSLKASQNSLVDQVHYRHYYYHSRYHRYHHHHHRHYYHRYYDGGYRFCLGLCW